MDRKLIFEEGSNKYYKVSLPKDTTSNSNDKIEKLFVFIGTNKPYKNREPIGSAYMAIRQKTNELLDLDWNNVIMRTSKREVAALRKYYRNYDSNLNNSFCVKIPFKIAYIFKAITILIDEIEKTGVKIPDNLKEFKNLTYADAFYNEYIMAYDACFSGIPLERKAQRALNGDFHNVDSPLNVKFK